ncbi:hypothetical protein [Streptomyces sp. NPDC048295]|uniref:hypothetical protein n=1 Tax=Streptomyces sp. NPDC048295 TaxID=3154617 RepID=UPI003420C5E1
MPLGTCAESTETLDGLDWIDHIHDRSPFTMLFDVAGTPAESVPVTADTGTGLPIGMQSAAGYGRDDRLLRLAGQLEQAALWSGRTPRCGRGTGRGAEKSCTGRCTPAAPVESTAMRTVR